MVLSRTQHIIGPCHYEDFLTSEFFGGAWSPEVKDGQLYNPLLLNLLWIWVPKFIITLVTCELHKVQWLHFKGELDKFS